MENQITEYNEFRGNIAKLIEENKLTAFDYESAKGEKEARSYIYKLRQTKTAVDATRKEIKTPALERCRLIDGEAKTLIETIEAMIEVHKKPLDEKAEREALRIAAIDAKIEELRSFQVGAGWTSELYSDELVRLKQFNFEGLDERESEARELHVALTIGLSINLQNALTAEAEQAKLEAEREAEKTELEILRKANIERLAKEQIAIEEKRKAEQLERIKAEAAQQALEAADKAHKLALEQVEAEKQRIIKEAADKAAAVQREADLAEKQRVALEEKTKADIAAQSEIERKRQANVNHQKTINNQVVQSLLECGITEDQAKAIVTSIAQGKIANLTINY